MPNKNLSRFWQGFWQLADPKIWVASTVPMAVGGALAFAGTLRFDVYWFFVSLLGIYLIEIGKNAVNEVVDFVTGVDRFVAQDKRTPFSGGKKTIVDGKLSVKEATGIAVATLLAAAGIGLYVVVAREPAVLFIGAAGLFLSVFYSLPPFRFAYRGLGEFVVGVTFGPLIVSGIYLVMTHTLDWTVLVVSLPIGFLIANVLWINQFPDYEADKQGNKLNWVVRLGKRSSVGVHAALFAAAYICLPVIAVVHRNPFWLLGLLSLPLASQSVAIARKFYDDIPNLIKANARTVMVYQLVSISMVIAALTNRLV